MLTLSGLCHDLIHSQVRDFKIGKHCFFAKHAEVFSGWNDEWWLIVGIVMTKWDGTPIYRLLLL